MNIIDINLEQVTIEDCLEIFDKKDIITIIQAGKVVGFAKED